MINVLFLLTLFLGGPATVLHEIGIFMTIQIFAGNPDSGDHLPIWSLGCAGVRLGLEVLARSAEMLFPWFLLLFLSMSLLLLSEIEWENAMPIFESGLTYFQPRSLSLALLFCRISY